MRFCVHIAAGLGLALLQTTSAAALQHRARDHSVAHEPTRHQTTRHVSASVGRSNARSTKRVNSRSNRASAHQRIEKKEDGAGDAQALIRLEREVRDLRRQLDAFESVRQELIAFKQKIWGPSPFSLALVARPPETTSFAAARSETPAGLVDLGSGALPLPDMRQPKPHAPRPADDPLQASLPAAIDNRALQRMQAKSAVEEAKAYLLTTARPGNSMSRQGATLAIERLHPAFAVKLAAAIKRARAAGLNEAGIFSAYRPPAFRIGGFKDKFKSLHAYGLAADMGGIGHAGSASARLWKQVAEEAGLYVPYGAANRAEFNHTQLIPDKVAPSKLHATIAATGPKDVRRMWLASGIDDYVVDVQLTQVAATALTRASDESTATAAADNPVAAQSSRNAGKRKTTATHEKPVRHVSSKVAKGASTKHGKSQSERRHAERDARRTGDRKPRGEAAHQRIRAASQDAKPHTHRRKGQA